MGEALARAELYIPSYESRAERECSAVERSEKVQKYLLDYDFTGFVIIKFYFFSLF